MPRSSRWYHKLLKSKFEERFLSVIRNNVSQDIIELEDNNPLIKDEKQMTMEPLYSPTCDVAIGPFAFKEGSLNETYVSLMRLPEIGSFIASLQEASLGDGYSHHMLELNTNPRCFIAIEVENTTAQDVKHLLGSVINCSYLGKIGIVVVFDEYREYSGRLLAYLAFLKRVKKMEKTLFRNVFVLHKSRMDRLMNLPANLTLQNCKHTDLNLGNPTHKNAIFR